MSVATFNLLDRNEAARQRMEAEQAIYAELRRQSAERLIVLGELTCPPQYTVIGLTPDLRPVAISQNTPQLVIALGGQGTGKTHLSLLLLDGIVAPNDGLGPMHKPPRVIRIGADWHQGVSGDQLRAGFAPNPSGRHWDLLRRYFGVLRRNAAIRCAYLLCLPESVDKFRRRYADLIERGLCVEPLRVHPTEMAQFGYGVVLNGGSEGGGRGKPAYRALIESIIASHGADATPALLRRELDRARLDPRVRDALHMQLQRLEQIISPDHHLVDRLERGWPVLVYLESRYLGQDQILPLEVALMNALSRPLRTGQDPHRWLMLDELNLHLANEGMEPFLLEAGAQLRHRPISLYLSGQRMRDIPSGLPGLATLVAQFNTASQAEFKRAQELFGVLHGLSYYKDVRTLRDGEALIGAMRATDSGMMDRAQKVWLRPSTLWTGGETVKAV